MGEQERASNAGPRLLLWLVAFHREWTKNDGKPQEQWEPGLDLKETVMIVALTICTALMALLIVVQIMG
ncbi:hypothetical protein D3C81_2145410 [compost metagenome]